MNSLWLPILLQLSAFAVLVTEFIIPSMGILTVLSLGLFGYSWYAIIQMDSPGAVWGFLMADIILIPILIKYSFSLLKVSPLAHSKGLEHGTGLNKVQEPGSELVGKTGVVESQLKPVGKAFVGNQLLEVSSEGEIIEKDTEICIKEIAGNKIIVESVNKQNNQ
jgi:membrane-bound serine protease (ClpP class)